MTINGAELLRMLGSIAAPGAAPGAPASGAPASGLDFASLLKQAGQVGSGLPVTVSKGAALELTNDQLARIAAAADRAESQGATRALVLIDGRALKLDVGVRQITGEADLKALSRAGGVLTGIDAVVSIPSAPAAAGAPGIVPLPRSGYANPSLLRLLGSAPPAEPAA